MTKTLVTILFASFAGVTAVLIGSGTFSQDATTAGLVFHNTPRTSDSPEAIFVFIGVTFAVLILFCIIGVLQHVNGEGPSVQRK
jgi:hypothetical protein